MHVKTFSVLFALLMVSMFGVVSRSEAGGVQTESQTNQPAIICVNPVFDFGSVYSDAVVKHSYVLSNEGSRVVKLIAVRASCSCSVAKASTNDIAPGMTASVEVVITLKGRRGRQRSSFYAETDDQQNRIVKMDFTGVVIMPVEAQPEGIHFGTVGGNERLEREVLLTAIESNTFQVLSAKSASPNMKITVEPREKGKQYQIKVVCDGPRKPGTFMTSVEVETDLPQMKTFSIPVAAFVAGDIAIAPATLMLVPSATNAPRTAWVNIWSPEGKAFKITKVELPGEGMTNSVVTLKSNRSRLEIKTWGALTGLDQKSIRVETDLASMKELFIPVKVLTSTAR